jgi:hypothetical protein
LPYNILELVLRFSEHYPGRAKHDDVPDPLVIARRLKVF